jgi:hypothetical protein
LYSAIAANKRNTFFIVGGFVLLLGGLAYWWGTASGNGSSALWIILVMPGTETETKLKIVRKDISAIFSHNH